MALPFVNTVAQSMPGFGSGSFYGSATQALAASGTLIIAATTTTPSTGGTPFNLSGGPAPSRGKIRVRLNPVGAGCTPSFSITVTDGTTTLQVDSYTGAAATSVDYTQEFTTDLSITSISVAVTLSGGTTTAQADIEVSLVN